MHLMELAILFPSEQIQLKKNKTKITWKCAHTHVRTAHDMKAQKKKNRIKPPFSFAMHFELQMNERTQNEKIEQITKKKK